MIAAVNGSSILVCGCPFPAVPFLLICLLPEFMPERTLGSACTHCYDLPSRKIDYFKQHIPGSSRHILHLVNDAIISMRATNCYACRPGALCCPLAAVCKVYFPYLI